MTTKSKIDVKALTVCALLAAMGVVCKAMFTFNITIGNMLLSRLGIHLIFVYLAAIMFGPLLGAMTGAVVDILGTLLEGKFAISLAYTVTFVLAGAAIWCVYYLLEKRTKLNQFWKILITVIIVQVIIVFPLNTLWNAIPENVPFWAEALKRSPSILFYVIVYPIILNILLPVMQKVLKIKKAAA